MRTAPWILCLWPGLPRLWLRGDWSGLFAAAAFALVLNATLLSSLVWPEWLPTVWSRASWPVTLAIWAVSAVWAFRRLPAMLERTDDPAATDLFEQAQSEYLQGDWYRAETLLGRLTRQNAEDVDARLALATLYRRTRRFGEAREELGRIGRLERAAKWEEEIRREWKHLERLEAETPAPRDRPIETEHEPTGHEIHGDDETGPLDDEAQSADAADKAA